MSVRRVYAVRALAFAVCVIVVAGCGNAQTRVAATTVAKPGLDDVHRAGRDYAGDVANGERLFIESCASCHGRSGRGGTGPSLVDESARLDLAQTIAWIEHPYPPMPRLYPVPLSERDVEDVAAYVQTLH